VGIPAVDGTCRQAAPAGTGRRACSPRIPPHHLEQATTHLLVPLHAARFIAHHEVNTGAELPRLINVEFDAFLKCASLPHGQRGLRRGDGGHDKLRAFSA
jgi:hypothetical protein